jgi:hypothetical protein
MLGFFDLLARLGTTDVLLSRFREAVSPAAEAALRAEGMVRPGPLARTYPCGAGEAGCSRGVRGFDDDDEVGFEDEVSPRRDRGSLGAYVAVCSRSPQACPFAPLDGDLLAQVTLARGALARTIVRVLALSAPRAAPRVFAPSARDDEPAWLGEEMRDGEPRDVALLLHPRRDLVHRLEARARDPRPATILVPNGHGVDPALFARHGARAHVELARLADLLTVRGGRLVATPRLRLLRGEGAEERGSREAKPPASIGALAPARSLPPLARWSDLRICMVDGESVLLTAYGVSSRRTHVDLGLASKSNRKPVKAWRVLVAMLEGEGSFVWRDFGKYEAAAKAVSELRIALKRALGLDADPLETLANGEGWRPRFVARREPPLDKMPTRR